MKKEDLNEAEFIELMKDQRKAFERFKSLINENNLFKTENNSLKTENNSLKTENNSLKTENNSLKTENKKKEAVIRRKKDVQIYDIDQTVYNSYDQEQNSIEKMQEEIDETKSAELLNKFKEYVNKIDIESINTGDIKNHEDSEGDGESKFLDKNKINSIIQHDFGKNLEMNEFIEAFGKAIVNNVNANWIIEDRKTFKNFLDNIIDTRIKEIFYQKVPNHIRQLRMDILLCSVLTKVYKVKAKEIEYIMIEESTKFSLKPLEKGIKFIDPVTSRNYIFNKDYIKFQINNNVGILNSYYKLIQKFVTNKFKEKDLKKALNDIIDETNIYFCNLPRNVMGITICNGDIFISGKFLQEALHYIPNNKYYNTIGISKIYLTLLHELSHKLQYKLRKIYNNKFDVNYFIKTFYFKSENDLNFETIKEINLDNKAVNYKLDENIKLNESDIESYSDYKYLHGQTTRCESGIFFDEEIYLGKEQKSVSKSISQFFLFFACQKYDDYVSIMKNILDKMNEPRERTTNCNYKLVEDQKVSCYFSYIRGYNSSF